MATYKEKKDAISAINMLGYNVLEVEISVGDSRFFIVRTFDPPVGGSVSAVPYLTWTGWDVTEFLVGNVYTEGMVEQFKIALESKDRDAKDKDYKWSDNHTWRYFE